MPVAPDELAVCVDLAVPAQVADQVEMQGRPVLAAEVLESHSERQVQRPTDLLVEEDVAREAVDLVVESERDLADAACTFVEVEQRLQIVLAARSFGRDDPPVLEAKPRVVDLAAAEDGGKPEPDRAVDATLDGTRVHLAVGKVLAAVGRAPGAGFDDDGQIRVLPDDAQLAHRAQLIRARLQLIADTGPVNDGV